LSLSPASALKPSVQPKMGILVERGRRDCTMRPGFDAIKPRPALNEIMIA
jgi:hypothetical protein